ncbi:MAG: thioredoxin family protein [Candidatus Omnitrophica bacterium]|nr:thioredoxin family protein [Candidatus Omnitrophota bacterium]
MATLKLGDAAPEFALPGVDGKTYRLADFREKAAVCVIFMCNHCPYVKATIDRMIAIQRDYAAKGVQFIGINSNETKNYPEDDLPHMIRWAKEKAFNFPYLRDDTQAAARAYGAERTPHIFLFDRNRKLCYTGAIDDNTKEESKVSRRYLREALDALLANQPLKDTETHAVGCTIKWAQ